MNLKKFTKYIKILAMIVCIPIFKIPVTEFWKEKLRIEEGTFYSFIFQAVDFLLLCLLLTFFYKLLDINKKKDMPNK